MTQAALIPLLSQPGQARIAGLLEQASDEARLAALARALAANPAWRTKQDAVLVVRPEQTPCLVLGGYFDEAELARLDALKWQLDRLLPNLRYVDYARVERDCARLASSLKERFGASLETFRFSAIPRGGHVVLGILAYLLDLRREQLEPAFGDTTTPLVIVDDCSLSGLRFRQALARHGDREVIFAHLYSPRALRENLLAREPRALACLSANTLKDVTAANLGAEQAAWRRRWRARGAGGYWTGQSEQVAFPWSEPDTSLWNSVTEQEERGWRFIPPESCLKNAAAEGGMRVRRQSPSDALAGTYSLTPDAVAADLGNEILVGKLSSGTCFSLEASAYDMWQALRRHRTTAEAVAALERLYDAPAERLNEDVEALVTDLAGQGLVKPGG